MPARERDLKGRLIMANLIESANNDFLIGKKVIIIDTMKIYSKYRQWMDLYAPHCDREKTHSIYYSGAIAVPFNILAIGKHLKLNYLNLYLVSDEIMFYIIEESGIKLWRKE